MSPACQADSLLSEPPGKPGKHISMVFNPLLSEPLSCVCPVSVLPPSALGSGDSRWLQGVSSLNKTQGREWQSQRHLATKCKLYRARSGPRSGQFLSAQLLNHILLLHLPITLAINIKKDISRTITDSIFSGPSKTLESKNRRQRRLDTQDYPAPLALNAFRFDFEAHGKQTCHWQVCMCGGMF